MGCRTNLRASCWCSDMTHKADRSFFKAKRIWSERKDQILGYYLVPYLPKLRTQRRPICIVDGFAGPGQFEDGNPGSPLIICRTIDSEIKKDPALRVSALLIEPDEVLFEELKRRVQGFAFADARRAQFLDLVPLIEERARTHSLFLYLDPFTVEGLAWEALDRVFAYLRTGTSVEILLNFNVDSLARRGLAALTASPPEVSDEIPLPEWEPVENPILADLDRIVGGDWWQSILLESSPYADRVKKLTSRFCLQLHNRFKEVCFHEVREKWQHLVPKYVLVFASRHPDALELMNDAMTKSREALAVASATPGALFETRPEWVVPDKSKLPGLILDEARKRGPRKGLVARVIRRAFCDYASKEIRAAITELLKGGRLASATGKSRINDGVEVWAIGDQHTRPTTPPPPSPSPPPPRPRGV